MEGRFKWELLVGTGVMGIERVGPTTGAHGNVPAKMREWSNGDGRPALRSRPRRRRTGAAAIHPSIHPPRTCERQSLSPKAHVARFIGDVQGRHAHAHIRTHARTHAHTHTHARTSVLVHIHALTWTPIACPQGRTDRRQAEAAVAERRVVEPREERREPELAALAHARLEPARANERPLAEGTLPPRTHARADAFAWGNARARFRRCVAAPTDGVCV